MNTESQIKTIDDQVAKLIEQVDILEEQLGILHNERDSLSRQRDKQIRTQFEKYAIFTGEHQRASNGAIVKLEESREDSSGYYFKVRVMGGGTMQWGLEANIDDLKFITDCGAEQRVAQTELVFHREQIAVLEKELQWLEAVE